MTDYFWLHKLRVDIAGLTISEPKIQIDIRREADSTPPTGHVSIYNLSETHEKNIHERGQDMILHGGFGDNIGLLFDGKVQRVEKERREYSRITKIKIGGKAVLTSRFARANVSMRSYGDFVPLVQIVEDLVTDMGLEIGPTDLIPNEKRRWYWNGSAAIGLYKALLGTEITWYEDDGTIRFNKPNHEQPDAETIELSAANGLIGAPTETDEGVKIRSLLRSSYRIGSVIVLDAIKTSGRFKITSVRHFGDNWKGSLYTDMDLRRL